MDPRVSRQTRQNAAQQLRQWASQRNVPLPQIEQMVTAVLSGQYDAQIQQAMPPTQNSISSTQQQSIFSGPNPPFTFSTPFGTVPFPSIPPPPIPAAVDMCLPLASMAPNMFPTPVMQATSQIPVSESTTTVFPGGEAIQQNSSYSGQQGNTTFQYSSSSTSMTFTPEVQMFSQPQPFTSMQRIQQPAMPIMPSTSQQFPYIPQSTMPLPSMPQPTMPQPAMPQPTVPIPQPPPLHPQQSTDPYMQPQSNLTNVASNPQGPILEVPAPPEPVCNPAAADQAPQNPRLAGKLKQKLDEATYFSDVPGMPDRSVRR